MTLQPHTLVWGSPNEQHDVLTERLSRALARIEAMQAQLAIAISERDMLARSLAMSRPSAEVVLAEMQAKQDSDGRADDASMVAVLREVGGLS
jgi:hypothetical protein